MPSTYQPRRPRASPLWQLVRHGWDEFLAHYEGKHRQSLGPLHPAATATVESFLRCGDLASGFTRHRFLHALREAKLISPGKLADLLSWKHSGFHIHDGGEKPVPAHDSAGRKRLAEYLLRHPFSLQKITWNASTQTVIKGGALPPGAHAKGTRKPSPSTGRQSILGIQLSPSFGMRPTARPRYQHKTRGQTPLIPDRIIRPPESSPNLKSPISNLQSTILLIPAPPKQSARDHSQTWQAPEIHLEDGRILVLEYT